MNARFRFPIAAIVVVFAVMGSSGQTAVDNPLNRDTVMVDRIYTGTDGQSHSEQIPVKWNGNVSQLMATTPDAEFVWIPKSNNSNWHVGPRRQYAITIWGRGEMELAGGQKIALLPGHINLIEDLTGKGHITRGSEDRLAIFIPLADQKVSVGPSR